jgi:hypothetical protein
LSPWLQRCSMLSVLAQWYHKPQPQRLAQGEADGSDEASYGSVNSIQQVGSFGEEDFSSPSLWVVIICASSCGATMKSLRIEPVQRHTLRVGFGGISVPRAKLLMKPELLLDLFS